MSRSTMLHTADQVPRATVIEQAARINSHGCANTGKSPAPSGRNLTAHVNTHHPQPSTTTPGKLRWGQDHSSQGDLTLSPPIRHPNFKQHSEGFHWKPSSSCSHPQEKV